nr:MFS transporter [uncultured Cupriavidus sp.]
MLGLNLLPLRETSHSSVPIGLDKFPKYRWLVLLVCWGALLLTFVDRLAWSNVASTAGTSFGLSVGALGVFVTAFYVGYVCSNLAGGIAVDLLGPRLIISLSILPLGVSTYLFGHVTSVSYGLVAQALMGVSAGCDYSACVKLIATWFEPRERGRAMGLLMTATSLAVTVTNALIPKMLTVFDWRDIYTTLGIATSLYALLCFVLLRDGPIAAQAQRQSLKLIALIRNRQLMWLALSGFAGMWGTWGFAFWANSLMMKRYSIAATDAGFVMVLVGLGAVISKPLVGLLADWIGGSHKTIITTCFFAFSVLLLLFGQLENDSQFRWIAPLLGVAAFAWSPLIALMIAEVAGPSLSGSATGVTNAFWQLGNVAAPLVVGIVFQSTNSFSTAFFALAVGPIIAAISMCFVQTSPAALLYTSSACGKTVLPNQSSSASKTNG